MPSEKITPFSGIKDPNCSGESGSIVPKVSATPVVLLGNGSLTLNCSFRSLQLKPCNRGCEASPVIAIAPARIDRNHPVDPNPVDTIMPDEDCTSSAQFHCKIYCAEVWLLGPLNKSLTANKD